MLIAELLVPLEKAAVVENAAKSETVVKILYTVARRLAALDCIAAVAAL